MDTFDYRLASKLWAACNPTHHNCASYALMKR
jgi:hypothetical protein